MAEDEVLPKPTDLSEPPDKATVVIDDGGDEWTIWWRYDEEAREFAEGEDERWFDSHDEDPLAWSTITAKARAVYAVTKIAEVVPDA